MSTTTDHGQDETDRARYKINPPAGTAEDASSQLEAGSFQLSASSALGVRGG